MHQSAYRSSQAINGPVSCAAGRLKLFYNNWNVLTLDLKILSWIKGYKIWLKSAPRQSKAVLNTELPGMDKTNVANLITQLITKGAVVACKPGKD